MRNLTFVWARALLCTPRGFQVLGLILFVALTGCGGDDDTSSDGSDTGSVDTTQADGTQSIDTGADAASDTTETADVGDQADSSVTDIGPDDTALDDTHPDDAGPDDAGSDDSGPDAAADAIGDDAADTLENLAPTVGMAALAGASHCVAWGCEALELQDEDVEGLEIRVRWEVGGEPSDATDLVLPADRVLEGDTVQCFAHAFDGVQEGPETASTIVTAADQPPNIEAVYLNDRARAGDVLTCQTVAFDDCTDDLDVSYAWSIDGELIINDTDRLETAEVPGDATISCTVEVGDGVLTSSESAAEVRLVRTTWQLLGHVEDAMAGTAVALLQDRDGDGFGEIVVGAPNMDVGRALQAGAVYVVFGDDGADEVPLATLVEDEAGFVMLGESGGYNLEKAVCWRFLNDEDCPYIEDVGRGNLWTSGPEGAGLGYSVVALDDMDGDGLQDLAVSAPWQVVSEIWTGRTYVLSSGALGEDSVVQARNGEAASGYLFDGECGRRLSIDRELGVGALTAGNGDQSGITIAALGDLNGDGLGDLGVGASFSGNANEGMVYVVYGRADGRRVTATDLYARGCQLDDVAADGPDAGEAGFAIWGHVAGISGGWWGHRVEGVGDTNGDGYDDILMHDAAGSDVKTYILLGADEMTTHELRRIRPTWGWRSNHGAWGSSGGELYGRLGLMRLAGGGGDVNADGLDDVLIGALDFDIQAELSVIYGRRDVGNRPLDNVNAGIGGYAVLGRVTEVDELRRMPGELTIVGDLNGDGFDDIAYGQPRRDNLTGRVYVLFGAASDPGVTFDDIVAGTGGFVIDGIELGETFGWSIAGGDVDGDGLADLLIGAPGATVDGTARAGRVLVHLGHDYTGHITHHGGTADDVFLGSGEADHMVGGLGDDWLEGGGGLDVLYGGGGDDVILIDDLSFRRIRGGAGEDRLVLGATADAPDLDQLAGLIAGFEEIELTGQELVLSTIRALRLSDTSNRVIVTGVSGQLTTVEGDEWLDTGIVMDGDIEYLTLSDGWAELWVDTRLEMAIPPTAPPMDVLINEELTEGTVAFTIEATDPDGDTSALTFALVQGDPGGAFGLDTTSGEVIVLDAALMDYEQGQRVSDLVVDVTDEDGLTTTISITVRLRDINEPPYFITDVFTWSVEEGGSSDDTIGWLAAVDADLNDTLSFAITADADGLFEVEVETGAISLREGSALDFETATSHELTVEVVDRGELFATADVRVEVLDRDRIEHTVPVTFSMRDRSIYEDVEASGFAGFEWLATTDEAESAWCLQWHPEDDRVGNWFDWNLPTPLGVISAFIEINGGLNGTLCINNSFSYDEGRIHADVPAIIELGFPDEVSVNTTVTVDTSYTFLEEGVAVWGNTSGVDLSLGISFDRFSMQLEFCLRGTANCLEIVDTGRASGEFSDSWGTDPVHWVADYGINLDGALVAGTPSLVKGEPFVFVIDWDSYAANALSLLGLPSNTGTIEWVNEDGLAPGEDLIFHIDYLLWQVELGFTVDSAWQFELMVDGLQGLIIREDGVAIPFNVGDSVDVSLPESADVDGDGQVDIAVSFVPTSTLQTYHQYDGAIGIFHSFFGGSMVATDEAGEQIGTGRHFGPMLERSCGFNTSFSCLILDSADIYEFSPTWSPATIVRGAIDLL